MCTERGVLAAVAVRERVLRSTSSGDPDAGGDRDSNGDASGNRHPGPVLGAGS